jgi:hypothetical protein
MRLITVVRNALGLVAIMASSQVLSGRVCNAVIAPMTIMWSIATVSKLSSTE